MMALIMRSSYHMHAETMHDGNYPASRDPDVVRTIPQMCGGPLLKCGEDHSSDVVGIFLKCGGGYSSDVVMATPQMW